MDIIMKKELRKLTEKQCKFVSGGVFAWTTPIYIPPPPPPPQPKPNPEK